jgi:hypothetical protein
MGDFTRLSIHSKPFTEPEVNIEKIPMVQISVPNQNSLGKISSKKR